MKAAEDFLILGVNISTYNPGSAEAIPKSFAYIEPGTKASLRRTTNRLNPRSLPSKWVWPGLFCSRYRIETLLEQANGKQILAALRSIWSGENPSKRYAGDHTTSASCRIVLAAMSFWACNGNSGIGSSGQ